MYIFRFVVLLADSYWTSPVVFHAITVLTYFLFTSCWPLPVVHFLSHIRAFLATSEPSSWIPLSMEITHEWMISIHRDINKTKTICCLRQHNKNNFGRVCRNTIRLLGNINAPWQPGISESSFSVVRGALN